jgi:NAD(P)-dependent dehydrogenase (short-subunit alcohol dehydrogenase family)
MDRDDVVVVTGSAKRVGREIALFLARKGCRLVLHYNTSYAEAVSLQQELHEKGTESAVVQGDLCDTANLQHLFSLFLKPFGRVDALVNSASVFSAKTIEDVDVATWQQDMALHAAAPFFLSKYLYLHLKERKATGSVVNITDTRLSSPTASRPSYYCSKGAMAGETKALAVALAPVVRVNEVAPGPVLSFGDGPYFSQMEQKLPLKTCGNPSDICQAIWYVLSSPFVTGETLHVDGGQHLL